MHSPGQLWLAWLCSCYTHGVKQSNTGTAEYFESSLSHHYTDSNNITVTVMGACNLGTNSVLGWAKVAHTHTT